MDNEILSALVVMYYNKNTIHVKDIRNKIAFNAKARSVILSYYKKGYSFNNIKECILDEKDRDKPIWIKFENYFKSF